MAVFNFGPIVQFYLMPNFVIAYLFCRHFTVMVMVKHVSTKKTRLLVIKWMLSTAQREGTKGLLSKCIHEFPQHFRQAEHSNMTKASKWWNGREAFLRRLDEERNHASMVQSSGGLQ